MIEVFLLGWVLTWFGIDDLVVEGINQLCNVNYSIAIYWFIIFIVAIIMQLKEK